MNIGKLNVNITGDNKDLKSKVNESMSKLEELKTQLGGSAAIGFEQLKSDLNVTDEQIKIIRNELNSMTANRITKDIDTTNQKLQTASDKLAGFKYMLDNAGSSEFANAAARQMQPILSESQLLTTRLALANDRLRQLNNQQVNRVAGSIAGLSSSVSNFGTSLNKTITHGMRKVKRFAVSLLGLRTIWALLTRAARDYMQRNEELDIKLKSSIAALGQALAPLSKLAVDAFQQLVKWIIVAIAYITAFSNAIFGTNFAINKSIKSMDKYADSAENAASQLSGFDEINNISSGSSTETLDFSAFDVSAELSSLGEFTKWLTDNKETIKLVTIAIAGFVAGLVVLSVIAGVVASMSALFNPWIVVLLMIGAIVLDMIINWDDYKSAFGNAVESSKGGFAIILKLIGLVGVAFALFILGPGGWLAGIALAVIGIAMFGEEIKYWLDKASGWFNGFIDGIKTWLLGHGLNYFASFIGSMQGMVNGFLKMIGGIITFIQGVFSGDWKKAWQGVKDIFWGIMGTLGSIFKIPVNAIIALINGLIIGINTAINGLNGFKFNVPSWIPFLGGKSFSLNIPNVGYVPYLASGAVVTGPTYAMIGEGSYNEAVIPLDNSPQFASMKNDIAQAVADALNGQEQGNTQVNIYLDDTMVGQALINTINRTSRLTGKTVEV